MAEMEEDSTDTNDESKCITDTVKAILLLDHSKKPFKQSDITGLLNFKLSRKNWTSVFQQAVQRLKDMGLVLKETKNSNSKSYFLVDSVFPVKSMHQYGTQNEVADRTLLIIVLTFIFMRETPVFEVDILNHLQSLKIYNPEKPEHQYFGDIRKKVFTQFISQLYLERIVDKESDTVQIKWGERANAEVTKRSILEFACAIGYQNTIEPKQLVSHYEKVLEEEEAGSIPAVTSE